MENTKKNIKNAFINLNKLKQFNWNFFQELFLWQ